MTGTPGDEAMSRVTAIIDAPRDAIYRAFLDPDAVAMGSRQTA